MDGPAIEETLLSYLWIKGVYEEGYSWFIVHKVVGFHNVITCYVYFRDGQNDMEQ